MRTKRRDSGETEEFAFKARFQPIIFLQSGNRALTAIVRTLRSAAALFTNRQPLNLVLSRYFITTFF